MTPQKKTFVSRNTKRRTEHVAADNELDTRNGSRRRILELTSAPNAVVAEILSGLIKGYGTVGAGDVWSPNGKRAPAPVRLGETTGFLKNPEHKTALREWWVSDGPVLNRALTQRQTGGREGGKPTRLPAFDLVSTYSPVNDEIHNSAIQQSRNSAILVISAAAHIGELNSDHAHQREKPALPQIRKALAEASSGWNALLEKRAGDYGYKLSHRVKLSTDAHYRLSCNFAVAWKLAQLGVPTILCYLGFLDALELAEDGRLIFGNRAMWVKCVFEKTSKPVPEEIWDATFEVPGGAPVTVLRKSLSI